MQVTIHPTAVVDSSAELGEDVEIGPLCIVGPAVRIGARTRLLGSVTVAASTHIGEDCELFHHSVIGGTPQVIGFKPAKPSITEPLVVIGNKCKIREGVTIHQSSLGPKQPTRIGNRVYIMTNVHVAHDCLVEDNVVIVTGTGLAGHCTIMKGATIGGMVGMHQHVRVGQEAFVAAGALLSHDALPYSMVKGNRARTHGLNAVGLKRKGWTDERIQSLGATMEKYFRQGGLDKADVTEDVQMMLDFVKGSTRGIALPPGLSSSPRQAKI